MDNNYKERLLKIFFKFFRERKPKPNEQRRGSVTIYPDRIVVDTYHKVGKKPWDWRSGTEVTRLPSDANKEEIGKAVRHHLELTRYNVKVEKPKMGIVSEYWLRYLDARGVKDAAELHQGAVRVEIYELEGNIRLVPTINGGSSGRDRGFHEKDWRTVKCKFIDSDEKLSAKIRMALKRCD